ncbi:unnamed protein product [Thelazia callipaeda]|uniref:G_PROTEIN_RECEP_F1_2 domain-containing protein n=1 Tax=Thelazia callipaeda TaxID=103827 RepID=A0A0N5DBG6_THECL|nr:unnamed protein product [Thelazia callipaeda]
MKVMLEDDCRFRPTIENYITIASFCIIFCLSVVGNAVVIIVILQQRSMRSVTNIYLLNLAITDLMLSLVCMPPTLISSVIYCWIFGDLLCKLFAYLQPVVVTASAYTLALIAFERYYAICKPLHSRIWHTRSHAYVMITLVWVISVLANLLMLFMFEQQTYNVNGLTCAPRHQPILHFYYQIYMTSVLLLIPLCIMVLLYGSVIHSLRNGMKMDYVSSAIYNSKSLIVLLHNSAKNERSFMAKQRMIKMLIVIVIIFFCCWTPNYMWWLLLTAQDSFKTFDIWNSQVNTAITVLCYISSCANPITYCFLNKKFRAALLVTFGSKRKNPNQFRTLYMPEMPMTDTPTHTHNIENQVLY